MQIFPTIKYCSLAFCILLVCAEMASSIPFYSDYENIRDLYEILLKKEALEGQLNPPHQIARKSNRSPSLRLRFGKKRDPYLANPQLTSMEHPLHIFEEVDN